jgi:UDP-N-acetylglucosamine 2-epimerase
MQKALLRHSSMRIASVVGARPNFIKLAPIHRAISTISEHVIIHTGQHYDFEMSEIFFKEFKLPEPDFNLGIGPGTQGFQIGEMIKGLEQIFLKNNKFDLVLVYGDTNSTLAGAIAANRLGFRTAHVESGLRSYDRRMPEEINRILTDNICDYLFAPTRIAVKNLKREHVHGKIFNTGDVAVEIIKETEKKYSPVVDKLGISPKSYILFTMHRAENTNSKDRMLSIIRMFEMLNDVEIVFPIHPRTRRMLIENDLYDQLEICKNVRTIQPLGYIDFIKLMQNAAKVVTDSGGVQKESYLLHVPCITIRRSTEWVETVKAGWNLIIDNDIKKIVKACREWNPTKPFKPIFGNGNSSTNIKNLIVSILSSGKVRQP